MSANGNTFRVPTTALPVRATLLPQGSAAGLPEDRIAELTRAAGFRAGYAQAAQEAAGALERAAERLDAASEAAREELTETAIELALEISKSILALEVEAGRYNIEKIVRESLAWSEVGRGKCTIHLNPDDVARLENVSFRAGTELEADMEVARGDVHVTTPRGLLVREVEETIQAIRDSLMGEHQ